MLSFGVTIPATVPQRSEIPELLVNYPVFGSLNYFTSSRWYYVYYSRNKRHVVIYWS